MWILSGIGYYIIIMYTCVRRFKSILYNLYKASLMATHMVKIILLLNLYKTDIDIHSYVFMLFNYSYTMILKLYFSKIE